MRVRPTRGGEPRAPRPSILAVLLLLVGIGASVATSAPSSSGSTSGTATLEPSAPTLHLTYVAKEEPRQNGDLEADLSWSASSTTGVEPELSVVSIGPTRLAFTGPASVTADDQQGDLELTVLNIDETGPVTIDWRASAYHYGADLDIVVSTRHERLAAASSLVSLPTTSTYGLTPPGFFTVAAEVDERSRGAGLVLEPGQDGTAIIDRLLLGPAASGPAGPAVVDGRTIVPWPEDCESGRCRLSFEIAAVGNPAIDIDAGDPSGSVTAGRRLAPEAVSHVELPAFDVGSGDLTTELRVEIADDQDLLTGHVSLSARLVSASDDRVGTYECPLQVHFSAPDEAEPLTMNLTTLEQRAGDLFLLTPGTTTPIAISVGAPDLGDCALDDGAQAVVEIGAVSFGIDTPTAPSLALP